MTKSRFDVAKEAKMELIFCSVILLSCSWFTAFQFIKKCVRLENELESSKSNLRFLRQKNSDFLKRINELEKFSPAGLMTKIGQAKQRELEASRKREEAMKEEAMVIAERQDLEAKLQLIERPSAFRSLARLPEGQRTILEEEPQRRRYNMGGEKENT